MENRSSRSSSSRRRGARCFPDALDTHVHTLTQIHTLSACLSVCLSKVYVKSMKCYFSERKKKSPSSIDTWGHDYEHLLAWFLPKLTYQLEFEWCSNITSVINTESSNAFHPHVLGANSISCTCRRKRKIILPFLSCWSHCSKVVTIFFNIDSTDSRHI